MMFTEKEDWSHKIKDDLDRRNRNWEKLDNLQGDFTSHLTDYATYQDSVDSRFEAIESQAHTHANKPVLDALSDDNGVLQYNGEPVGGSGGSTEITEQAIVDALGYTPADEENVYPKQEIDTKLNGKVDKVFGKQLSTEDYTSAEKAKLAGIESGANNYSHPTYHPASMIIETSDKRFVSDAEKSTWNNKANANHDHDTRYYTKAEIDAQIGDIGALLASI